MGVGVGVGVCGWVCVGVCVGACTRACVCVWRVWNFQKWEGYPNWGEVAGLFLKWGFF